MRAFTDDDPVQARVANGTELVRSPGTSLHRQLFVVLRDQIMRGVYQPGAMIPNEDELCREFSVSRITVRRAVSDLEAKDLLEKRQGRGTFVAAQVPSAREATTLSFVDALKESIAGTRKTLVSMTTEVPPADIARQLDLIEGSKATKTVRLHSATLPVLLVEAWVHEEIGRNISEDDLPKTALHELLVSQGILFGRAVQEITAVAATPVTAKLLLTEFGTPLVKMTRLLYDTSRRPVQHTIVYFSPERSRLLMEVAIGSVNTLAAGVIFHDMPQGETE